MKVKIGPYINWIGPYQIASGIFFWLERYPDDKKAERWDYRLHEKFGDWLADTWVTRACDWIHNKNKRNIKVHIDPWDTWSMDHTLSLIILPMLQQLKDTNHGYGRIDDDDCCPIEKGAETDYYTHENDEQRWAWLMDELIWTFNEIASDHPNEPDWKSASHEEREAYHKRISNGTKLFGKYYQSLWD